jgi:hypothetical protein
MDVNELIEALDNEKNENLVNFTTKKINKIKRNILKKLGATKEQMEQILPRLEGYQYVDEIQNFQLTQYLKSIPLDKNDLILYNRGLFYGTKIGKTGILVLCKNKRFRCVKLENNIFFQKLTNQQLIILSAMDHLQTNETDSEDEMDEMDEMDDNNNIEQGEIYNDDESDEDENEES